MMAIRLFIFFIFTPFILATIDPYHPKIISSKQQIKKQDHEDEPSFWQEVAQAILDARLEKITNSGSFAKNVIFFLGDGMSVPTITAARAFAAAEETTLAFDRMSHTGVSKTYCVDYQVPDSACTATAYLTGIKNNMGTIGVSAKVARGDCEAMANTENHVYSIAKTFQDKGKWTGFVTTTAVTDASPSGLYAHTAERNWQSDTDVESSGEDPSVCQDIATQLITNDVGSQFRVILGGGRTYFKPLSKIDEEGDEGKRSDGVDLIEEWLASKNESNAKYIWNRNKLLDLNENVDYVLGLFESGHCKYNLKRDPVMDPTLEEMTEAAIKILKKSTKGYFLFVEGGRIDHAHHETKAHISLDETLEFSKAIDKALDITDEEDTLIVVTSDHAHTFSYSGYAVRGSNVLGTAGTAGDELPYTIINYANGPGYKHPDADGNRFDLTNTDLDNPDFQFPANAYLSSETHGGDDVLIFAHGPHSELFTGVMEQNAIPKLVVYASKSHRFTYSFPLLLSCCTFVYLSILR